MDDQSMTQQGTASEQAEAWSPDATERQDDAGTRGAYVEPMPYIFSVHEALIGSEAAARQAGKRVLAESYEQHRVTGVAAMEMAVANAQVVASLMKWNGEDFATISDGLGRIETLIATAREAVEARLQLSVLDAQADRAFAEAAAGA